MFLKAPAEKPNASRIGEPLLSNELQSEHLALLSCVRWPGNNPDDTLRIGLTSCRAGEGVSTVAGQLAVAAATVGHGKVLLVEGNLFSPNLHNQFSVPVSPGMAEYLLGEQSASATIQTTNIPNLSILPGGDRAKDVAHLLVSDRVDRLMLEVQSDYSLIVFDMAPLDGRASTLSWVGCMDAVLLVIEADRVRWETARRAKEQLKRAGANLGGAILNKRRTYVPRWLQRSL